MKEFIRKLFPESLIIALWHRSRAVLAAVWYGFPAKKLTVIAVAGTKGKTSTAYFISHILDYLGVKNALVSTAALKMAGEEKMNTVKMTTPPADFLQKFLRQAVSRGCTHVVLEVSSHALEQYRTWGIPFSVAVLTNLMPDHLEYHGTAEHYQHSHKKLITPFLKKLILNGDDNNLSDFFNLPVAKSIFKQSEEVAEKLRISGVPMMSHFNASNILAAYYAVSALGFSHEKIMSALKTLHGAPGRLERIDEGQPFTVIVDYAHSVDSLTNFFEAIKPEVKGNIIVVYGACGDRDPSQRVKMGEVLDQCADSVVVTNDDPYSEDPEKISSQLKAGITSKKWNEYAWEILDRRGAIQKALSLAHEGDCVCILGKGAEQWQIFKDTKIPWDDRQVVRELLKSRNSGSV
ncbi:MAG: UDP-N-acetylmuramoyl-L-alanyl-D-glutamate--2,6-diaminopimelate ligase [bacterium]|nr:UDP-N-acetylmuramoyl-L-alanyl-D-glutamate--2,6-diaminopimelate ligase [bacterium]